MTWDSPGIPFLKDFDVLGAKGCQPFPHRANILVDVVESKLLEDRILVHCHQFFPEGFGVGAFHGDFLNIPKDVFSGNQLTILWDVRSPPPPKTFLWMLNVLDTNELTFDFSFDNFSEWLMVNTNRKNPLTIRHLELFAGGFGGWKGATQVLTTFTTQKFQTVAIELNQSIAKSYALTNGTNFAKPQGKLPTNFLLNSNDNWILVADVKSPDWLPAVCGWMPHFVSISAPCPPWSGASRGSGLSCDEGLLFPYSILLMRWIRPAVILIENVVGFSTHPHKSTIMRIFTWMGYKVIWQRCVDLIEQSLTHRVRWLCMAVRIHDHNGRFEFHTWNRCDRPPNSLVADLFPEYHRLRLQVTEEIFAIASDPNMHKSVCAKLTPKDIIALRTFDALGKIPTFMARYGSQHELTTQFLIDFGYFGHFLKDENFPFGMRFWHPCEIQLIHGCLHGCFISKDIIEAWMIAGNIISIPHALLLLCNMCNCIGTIAMHTSDIMRKFHHRKLCHGNCRIVEFSHGMFVVPIYDPLPNKFLQHAHQLLEPDTQDQWKFWTPLLGCIDELPGEDSNFLSLGAGSELSRVSFATIEDVISPTLDYSPVVQASIHFQHGEKTFWYDSKLSSSTLEMIWFGAFACHFCTEQQIAAVLIHKGHERQHVEATAIICLIIDQQLTVVGLDSSMPLLKQPKIIGMQVQLFDQFGELTHDHVAIYNQLVVQECIQYTPASTVALYLLASFRLVQVGIKWNFPEGSLFVSVVGDTVAQQILIEFWSGIITSTSMAVLGFEVFRELDEPTSRVAFRPVADGIQCLPKSFELALFVAGIRSFLDSLAKPTDMHLGIAIVIKVYGRILWQGDVSHDLNILTIEAMIQSISQVFTGGVEYRFVVNGKKYVDVLLKDIPHDTNKPMKIHLVESLHGGAGSKQQQRTLQQTALAGVFLEQGYELTWTTKAVESILQHHSMAKVQHITAQPMGKEKIDALLQLCRDAKIVIPEVSKPQSRAVTNAPWNKKKRIDTHVIDPAEYTIAQGFFKNADGSESEQIFQMKAQATGVCLLTSQQASPWLQPAQKISADEFAVVVVGSVDSFKLSSVDVVVPCLNKEGQMVLLSGHLFQLGGRDIKFETGTAQSIVEEEFRLMALTFHKSDWDQGDWNNLLHSTIPQIKKILAIDHLDASVQSIWGRSLRAGRSPASPIQATSIQVHCTVAASKVDTFLSKTGFNKVYSTPKTKEGRLSNDYRVIWCQGELPQATIMATQTVNCLGLIHGKTPNTYGLRFKTGDFEAAWKHIHPDEPMPITTKGDLVYKVEGLPFGCTQNMILAWSKAIKWEVFPVRTLGPQAWLLRTESSPPPGIVMFNASPVLITFLPPRGDHKGKMVVGPIASSSASGSLSVDPWANAWSRYKPTTGTIPRPVEGPAETRFAAQDEKLAQLRTDLDKLAASSDSHAKLTTKKFQELELREKKNTQHLQSAMEGLRKDVDQSLKSHMQQQTSQMDNRFNELKDLFKQMQLQTQKRKSPEGQEDSNMEG